MMKIPWENKPLWRILLAAYICLVLFLCFGKFEASDEIPRSLLGIPADKIVHFLMFSPFVILSMLSFAHKQTNPGSKVLTATIAFIVVGEAFAALTEFGQGLTDYRSKDPLDLLADSLGIVAGACAYLLTRKIQEKKSL